jgi:hypothetical protein
MGLEASLRNERPWPGRDGDTLSGVFVDNASSMTNAHIARLVLTADRSMQDGSPNAEPLRKGLVNDGDRVCVTDRYLAWFDYTLQDGVPFDAPYGNNASRAGTLAGLWTLDPLQKWFRHRRPSPDGSTDEWAHNELIPGSASPDGGQFWWDQHAPPVEHTFLVIAGADVPPERHGGWGWFFVSYHFSQMTPKSEWVITDDGRRSADGVHYRTSAYLSSWRGQTDMVDGEDEQDIKNRARSSVEYICRPDDIVIRWRLSPETADISVTNMYVGFWLAYAGDNDGHPRCDPAPGEQWPSRSYGQPLYVRSSEWLGATDAPSQGRTLRAGTIGKLTLHEPACDHRSDGSQHWDYYNTGMYTETSRVRAGSWIEVGEDPQLSSALPTFRVMVLSEPLTGAGSADDPQQILWDNLNIWHENVDSTIGMGTGSPSGQTILKAGRWYESLLSVSSAR